MYKPSVNKVYLFIYLNKYYLERTHIILHQKSNYWRIESSNCMPEIPLFHRVPIGTWTHGKPGDLNFPEIWKVQKWSGICPKKWENLDKTRNLAENQDKTWNIKIYKISILYWDNVFHVLYSCEFRTSLVSAIWRQNCPHYNLENDLLDMDKTLRYPGILWLKQTGNPDFIKMFWTIWRSAWLECTEGNAM